MPSGPYAKHSSRLRRGVSLPAVRPAWLSQSEPPYRRARARPPRNPSWSVRIPECARSVRPESSETWRERGTRPEAPARLPPPSGRWSAASGRRRSESPGIQLRPVEGDRPSCAPDRNEIRPQGPPESVASHAPARQRGRGPRPVKP